MTVRKNMTLNRRTLLSAGAAAVFMPAAAHAQPYPSRIIRIIVPFAAGGGSDIVARLVGERLGKRLQQTVIIENKPGAGAIIGADSVAKSPPDGYTLLFATPGPQILNPHLVKSLPYDPKDFVGVATLLMSVNLMVVSASVPAKTVRELIDYAKANPGKLNFASSGIGTSSHLAGELFKSMAGIDITHVPYRGNALALQDLLSGTVQISIDAISAMLPHARSGTLRALGVASPDRSTVVPEIPTIAETLPGYESSAWFGLFGPARMPPELAHRLADAARQAIAEPAMRKRFDSEGVIAVGNTPEQFGPFVQSEIKRWAQVVKYSGARPE